MKSLVSLILFAIVAMAVVLCTSCTETEYKEIIKYIDRPALAPTIITIRDTVRDTVSVNVVIHETDTVIKVVTKEVIKVVEKIVNHYDTIINNVVQTIHDTTVLTVYDRTVIYKDTFWVATMIRPVNNIPAELLIYVQEFYQLAGPSANGGPMIIQYVHPEDLAGENWSSDSFWFGGQWSQMVIELDESLPGEQHRAGILRELARLQLKKKYVTDVNKIMCPLFNPARTITQSDLNVLFQIQPI